MTKARDRTGCTDIAWRAKLLFNLSENLTNFIVVVTSWCISAVTDAVLGASGGILVSTDWAWQWLEFIWIAIVTGWAGGRLIDSVS